MDLLMQSALAWKNILNYTYEISYGYKGVLHDIKLSFSAKDFPHLVGFQYLKDISIPKYNSGKIIDAIIDGKIKIEDLKKSSTFSQYVMPRLNALCHIQESLDSDFRLYSFFSKYYPFYTNIRADYIIASDYYGEDFIFIIKEKNIECINDYYVCCSIFEKENRDYKTNQRPRVLLKKEKINVYTGERKILFDKLKKEKMLEFGTAGIRGIMGPEDNNINTDVIRKVTQALSNYLNNKFENPSVVISYDSRNNSFEFAKEAARVLSGNGIKALLWSEIMPVPVLSYSVRHLKCTAGIMITASHNPKEYNGYKVYGPNGGQILEEDAKIIQDEMINISDSDIKTSDDYELVNNEVYDAYKVRMEYASNFNSDKNDNVILGETKNLKIIYTPLNGSGRKPVTDMLYTNGYSYTIVSEQEKPDGNFKTCPNPNPEKDEVYDIAIKYAKEIDADIIVATDPDCDRVGCMVKNNDGYKLLNGNELGTLMTYFLCEKSKGDTVVCSFVSTPIIEKIAKSFDCNVIRTPVGFKYIGDKMDLLGDKFIFGFEESNGFLVGDYARDKDGVVGTKIILCMAEYYKTMGMTLIDVLSEVYNKYGLVINKTISKELKPKDKKPDMTIVNHDDGSRIIIRPSGTEPKVKYYISAPSEERLNELMNDVEL